MVTELRPFSVIPVGHCASYFSVLGFFCTAAIAATCFLFFLRVRAVYLHSQIITIVFGAIWLGMTALNVSGGIIEIIDAGQF